MYNNTVNELHKKIQSLTSRDALLQKILNVLQTIQLDKDENSKIEEIIKDIQEINDDDDDDKNNKDIATDNHALCQQNNYINNIRTRELEKLLSELNNEIKIINSHVDDKQEEINKLNIEKKKLEVNLQKLSSECTILRENFKYSLSLRQDIENTVQENTKELKDLRNINLQLENKNIELKERLKDILFHFRNLRNRYQALHGRCVKQKLEILDVQKNSF